jgi:hypothetical protein
VGATLMRVKRVLALSALGLGFAFSACGQSDEEKANADVCDARDDIQANVKELQSLTLGNVTADKAGPASMRSKTTSRRSRMRRVS